MEAPLHWHGAIDWPSDSVVTPTGVDDIVAAVNFSGEHVLLRSDKGWRTNDCNRRRE